MVQPNPLEEAGADAIPDDPDARQEVPIAWVDSTDDVGGVKVKSAAPEATAVALDSEEEDSEDDFTLNAPSPVQSPHHSPVQSIVLGDGEPAGDANLGQLNPHPAKSLDSTAVELTPSVEAPTPETAQPASDVDTRVNGHETNGNAAAAADATAAGEGETNEAGDAESKEGWGSPASAIRMPPTEPPRGRLTSSPAVPESRRAAYESFVQGKSPSPHGTPSPRPSGQGGSWAAARPRSASSSAASGAWNPFGASPTAANGNPFAVVTPPGQRGSPLTGRRGPGTGAGGPKGSGSPRLSAHDTGLCQKLGLTSMEIIEYGKVWQTLVNRKMVDKYGRVPKAPVTSFLLLSKLPKKTVKACYVAADRRHPQGFLDRSDFFVALKYIALAQAGVDFASVPPTTRVALPMLDGILDPRVAAVSSGGSGGGGSRLAEGGSPKGGRSSFGTSANSSSNGPPVPTSKRPLPAPPNPQPQGPPDDNQYCAMDYTAMADLGLDSPSSASGPVPPPRAPGPKPELPPRSTEQMRTQHNQLRTRAATVGSLGAGDGIGVTDDPAARTPEEAVRDAQVTGGAGASARRLKSDVEVEDEDTPLNLDLFGIGKGLIIKSPEIQGYSLITGRTFKEEARGQDVILVDEPKSLKSTCTVKLSFSPRMAGLYFNPKSGDGDRDAVIALLQCKFASQAKWKSAIYGKVPAFPGQSPTKKMSRMFYWGEVEPFPAIGIRGAVFKKAISLGKKKVGSVERLLIRPLVPHGGEGQPFPGWDVVAAVRPTEVHSAPAVATISLSRSKAWTGQPEDCYKVNCDTGDLALTATLAYIVCMATRPKRK